MNAWWDWFWDLHLWWFRKFGEILRPLGWPSAKGMDLLGNGSVMALGQAGKRWSWGRLYGCGIWHLKNAVTSRTQKSYMKKFAPRKGITRIVHDCTSWAPQTVEHFVFVKDHKHNLTVVRHCNKNDKMGSQCNDILPQAPPATQYTVPRWYCWWKNSYTLTYLPYWCRISSINSQYVWFLMERFVDLSCCNWRLEVRKEQEWLSLGITHILKFQRLK